MALYLLLFALTALPLFPQTQPTIDQIRGLQERIAALEARIEALEEDQTVEVIHRFGFYAAGYSYQILTTDRDEVAIAQAQMEKDTPEASTKIIQYLSVAKEVAIIYGTPDKAPEEVDWNEPAELGVLYIKSPNTYKPPDVNWLPWVEANVQFCQIADECEISCQEANCFELFRFELPETDAVLAFATNQIPDTTPPHPCEVEMINHLLTTPQGSPPFDYAACLAEHEG